MINFKDIHIGKLINQKVTEDKVDVTRICSFLKCSTDDVNEIYASKSVDSAMLLRWSKLLTYDFFRVYSQHILLFSSTKKEQKVNINEKSSLPEFRKNIYTKEIIDFILEAVNSGKMTKQEVIEKYKIPKTTLYKWVSKYSADQE